MLLLLYRQSWWRFLLAVVTAIVGGLASAGLVKTIGDGAADSAGLTSWAASFFALCGVLFLAKTCSEWLLVSLAQELICRMQIELCRKILVTPYKKLESLGKARLHVLLTTDIATITVAAQLGPSVFANCIVIVVCLCYLALLSWQLLLSFMICLVIGVAAYSAAERPVLRKMRRWREQVDALHGSFRSLLEGTKELQLNSERGRYFVDDVIASSAQRVLHSSMGASTGYVLVANAGNVLLFLIIGLTLFVVPAWLPQQTATVGIPLAFLLLYLIAPIGRVVFMLPFLRQGEIARGKIRQLDADLEQYAAEQQALPQENLFTSAITGAPLLRLRGVCHRFPGLTEDAPFMLGLLDLTIKQNEILFIAGGNGSGKTTLAMLLLGFYQPEAGTIELNGVQVSQANLPFYRQYFSAVFADFHLFDEIFAGDRPDLTQQAGHYLTKLGLSHKVTIEANRFSTTSLSLGQRKRMALVSAYLEDRPIYLFDEWAADQDPGFKRVFYTQLLPELKRRGKTIIVVSHDDSYFDCADRVIKLEAGKLVQTSIASHFSADLHT
jgi:putative ATP-binding cassette transporter